MAFQADKGMTEREEARQRWMIMAAAFASGVVLTGILSIIIAKCSAPDEPADGEVRGTLEPSGAQHADELNPQWCGVYLAPRSPSTDQDISAHAVGNDREGQPVKFAYEWTVNTGVVMRGAGRDTLPAALTSRGDYV